MKFVFSLLLTLFLAELANAQSPSLIGFPFSGDATCGAGEYFLGVNTSTSTWRKCQNGVWTDMATGAGGENTTASNLGGGRANFSVEVGDDLRFNTFDTADFILTGNLISIDDSKWAKDSEIGGGGFTYAQAVAAELAGF